MLNLTFKMLYTPCDVQQVTALQQSILLTFSKFFDFITGLIAIPITLYALRLCIKPNRFHINFRMIGAIHCFCLFVHCVGRFIQNASAIYLWMFIEPVCEQRMYFALCLPARLMYIFGLYSSSLSSLFMCIERTIATKFYAQYENKSWHLGVVLVISQVVLSIIVTLGYFGNSVLVDRPAFCYFDFTREFALGCESVMITANIIGFWQCRRLNRINTNIRSELNTIDLGQKFQVEENKMLIRIMDTFTKMDFGFMMVFFSFGGFQQIIRKYIPVPTFFAVYELIHCVPLYAIIVLILMMKVIGKLRAQQSQEIIKVVQTKDDAYFHYFSREWK